MNASGIELGQELQEIVQRKFRGTLSLPRFFINNAFDNILDRLVVTIIIDHTICGLVLLLKR